MLSSFGEKKKKREQFRKIGKAKWYSFDQIVNPKIEYLYLEQSIRHTYIQNLNFMLNNHFFSQ